MIDIKKLCKFLVKAKRATYASGNTEQMIISADKSTTLNYDIGSWKYNDNYFGGEPYGGREVVFFRNIPVYMMVYYGRVDESITDFTIVYKFLQNALTLIPEDKPFRGPKKYTKNKLVYINNFNGEITNFFGEETVELQDGKQIYTAKYIGGLIDLRQ